MASPNTQKFYIDGVLRWTINNNATNARTLNIAQLLCNAFVVRRHRLRLAQQAECLRRVATGAGERCLIAHQLWIGRIILF